MGKRIENAIKKIEFSNIDVVWNGSIDKFHKLIHAANEYKNHYNFCALEGKICFTEHELLSLAENGRVTCKGEKYDYAVLVTKWGGQVDERTHKVIEKKKYVVGLDADEFGSDANTKMTDEEMYELAINDDEYRFPMYEEREFFYKLNSDEIDTENKCWFLIEVKTRI